ncbi:hypothetical protein [Pedobacter punctiformis]|uniref:CSD domain-containing protein n=1 Tax=Pedobacter punctiformis TaxID=3004097 RepID=A0ABT4L8P3_9SPHI|nr:hypothetical protein [Pedobacter sp. HCMS5-2]MCZ4244067.1 hypothetical protein [Pedobacter sp. HCMS5-2]
MIRKGTITFIDEDRSGVITDENEQEITFSLENYKNQVWIGMDIYFVIEMSQTGLVANGIEPA